MRNTNIIQTIVAALLLNCSITASAQMLKHERLISFEEQKIPVTINSEQSSIAISTEHYKDGKQSLSWTFAPKGVLSFKQDLKFEKKDITGKDLYLSTFVIWIYNEKPSDTSIHFDFLKDGKICTSFPFNINFTGWRSAWVSYERDMQGTPEEGMNELRISAPDIRGKLYLDHIVTATKVDPRHQTPDVQVPFVNKGTTNHWMVLLNKSLQQPDIPLSPITASEKQAVKEIEKRFRQMIYTPKDLTEQETKRIRKMFSSYKIGYSNNCINGIPLFLFNAFQAFERLFPELSREDFNRLGVEMREYFDWMKRVATAYNNAPNSQIREEMKEKFLAMYNHAVDQGVAYGSCWGNIHHYGYAIRSLYTACFLMKDVLRDAGLLDEAARILQWYAITNDVYPKPMVNGINIDIFNTQTIGRIASILIMRDTPEKIQYLRSFSRWIDYACRPAPGLNGSFKVDGSAFHHCNNYPAYAVGGLEGATNMIYLLSRTTFSVSELAHQTVKKALLTMRFYCNTKQWPLSMSGRHPNGEGALTPLQYATMALAGSPDGKQEYDSEMASAYLRLVTYKDTTKKTPNYSPKVSPSSINIMKALLESRGFRPEPDPQGNLALGYGCVSVQRRNNWAAVVRGHSRYLWAAEHYLPANFYGRYLAHGSMQILTGKPDETVTFATSGWQEAGFDWNRIPGVTSIHLPFDRLRARVLNVDTFSGMEEMLYSDEAFAGGLSQAHLNGNFGMVLHEHDKYNGSHRARKSFHFFDGTIVCLGTDIENLNTEYPTETTVFQLAAITPETRRYWETYQSDGQTYIDPNGVGYYISKASLPDARYEKNFPQVTVGERSAKPTSGDWVSLTLQHGKAPKGASYEYAVLPHTDAAALKAFAKKPTYQILRQDRKAHIVCSPADSLTSYVLFETPQALPDGGLLQKADTSCLVMIRKYKDKLLLTVSQPDLALYRGPSDEVLDQDGKRIERSIYSRPWIDKESLEIPVTVTLKGLWKVTETPYCKLVYADKKKTILRFACKDAASFDIELKGIID